MYDKNKTAPADTGNAVVRLWPSEVNAAGVITNPLKSIEYKPKGAEPAAATQESDDDDGEEGDY